MDLSEFLQRHALWLESDGEEGERANLEGANLKVATLEGANLEGANLEGANLWGANLWGARGIFSFGPMPTSGRIVYAVRHANGFMVKAGCFWGDLEALKKAVTGSHNCPMYLGIIDLLEKM